MGDCHGSEDLDHYVIKCMVKKAAQELTSGPPRRTGSITELEVKLKDPHRDFVEDKRTADALIKWIGFGFSVTHHRTFIEVQRDMKERKFLEKIEFYKSERLDFGIIDIDKLPHNNMDDFEWESHTWNEILKMDFEYVKAVVEEHIPRKRRQD